ncbi:tyrosine-type recombinase/integrase [uncultured Anaerovibrio sp.]|uniref:tyrosine-type recombinase/integrase n=1 Tax=uncultured Anaerovibrio sp. TaxID=361586 RepID=UPI002624DCB3|nr:tyrosine-type recombinase/integrase [uncultured Anaerovibrio sp.]
MAQVRTRKRGKTYSYIFEAGKTLEGKRKVVEKGGFATKDEAYNAGVEAFTSFKHGNIGITSEKLTVGDYLDLWLQQHSASLREQSILSYKCGIKALKKYIGNIILQELKPRNVAAMVNTWYCEDFSYATIARRLATLKTALDYAVFPAELITFNPVINVKVPKNAPRNIVERVVITPEKFQEILEADKRKKYHAPLMLAYHTGMRIREIFGLVWDNVDLKNGIIYVKQQLKDRGKSYHFASPKTSSSVRTIYMDSELLAFLQDLKREQDKRKAAGGWMYCYENDDGYFFYTTSLLNDRNQVNLVCLWPDGRTIAPDSFSLFLRKNGLNSHSFRHTHATMLVEANASPKEIAGRLGHKTTDITLNLYTHETEAMQKNVASVFEKTLKKNADEKVNADKLQTI